MNTQSFLLILILAAALAWAAVRAARRLRKGSACCGEKQAAVRREGPRDRRRGRYPYAAEAEITGMTCDNCAARVENALNGMEGVWARVRIDTRRAELRCKNPPDEQALRDCVRRAGYGMTGFRVKESG